MFKTLSLSRYLVKLGVFLVILIATTSVQYVLAGNGQSGVGWLWGGSDTGTVKDVAVDPRNYVASGPGWISLNSSDCDADNNGFVDVSCGGNNTSTPSIDYGVNIPLADGVLSGYAWSDRFGWISFNAADVTGCPSGICNARRVGSALKGWARILSLNGTGDWKGFVAIDQASSGGSVSYSGVNLPSVMIQADDTLSGYIYSDEVGWIDVSRASIRTVPTLQLCRDGGSTPFAQGGETRSLALNLQPAAGSTANMTTFFDTTPDCFGTDVTMRSTFTDNAASSVVTISPNGSNPNVFMGNDVPGSSAAGQQSASETVTVFYSGQTITVPVTVIEFCSSNCTAAIQAGTCQGQLPNPVVKNSCGGDELSCLGTRSCDFNWKEVAPQ